MNERILVTGGAGFIGHHLLRLLLKKGYKVSVIDDLSMGKRENIPRDVTFIEGDINNSHAVQRALKNVDVVCHLAAKVSVRASLEFFYDDALTNVMGTLNLLRFLKDSSVRRFCFASSMAVYSDSESPAPIPEDHPTIPLSPYGQSKLTAEFYIRNICSALDIEWYNLRLFNTYGPGQTLTPYVGVITIFFDHLIQGRSPVIFGDGEQRRDYVHVSDITRAFLNALTAPKNSSGSFNIGTGQATSVNELFSEMTGILKIENVEPLYKEFDKLELRNSIPDINAASKVLDYRPQVPLKDGLAETIKAMMSLSV